MGNILQIVGWIEIRKCSQILFKKVSGIITSTIKCVFGNLLTITLRLDDGSFNDVKEGKNESSTQSRRPSSLHAPTPLLKYWQYWLLIFEISSEKGFLRICIMHRLPLNVTALLFGHYKNLLCTKLSAEVEASSCCCARLPVVPIVFKFQQQ